MSVDTVSVYGSNLDLTSEKNLRDLKYRMQHAVDYDTCKEIYCNYWFQGLSSKRPNLNGKLFDAETVETLCKQFFKMHFFKILNVKKLDLA